MPVQGHLTINAPTGNFFIQVFGLKRTIQPFLLQCLVGAYRGCQSGLPIYYGLPGMDI